MSQTSIRSNAAQNENTNAAEQQVKNRIVETRGNWDAIFAHAVSLVVAHVRGQQVSGDPRNGFGFKTHSLQPHAKGYAQSLLAGFTGSKAGKVFAKSDELMDESGREKIAIAILISTRLAKGAKGETDDEAAKRMIAKTEPKREKAFAEAVLAALAQPIETPATPSKEGDSKNGNKGKK